MKQGKERKQIKKKKRSKGKRQEHRAAREKEYYIHFSSLPHAITAQTLPCSFAQQTRFPRFPQNRTRERMKGKRRGKRWNETLKEGGEEEEA